MEATNTIVGITNVVQTVIEHALPGADFLSSTIRQMSTLSNEVLFVVFLIGINWLLKKAPSIYDELIPVLSVLAAFIGYPCLFGFTARNFFIGFGIGFIPVGIHQLLKQVKAFRVRISTGDTEFIKKPGKKHAAKHVHKKF